jgi:hypothetical protein
LAKLNGDATLDTVGVMRVALAIVIAGVLIAAAILIVLRWEISAATGVVYRIDRWTGTACTIGYRVQCWRPPMTEHRLF